MTGIRLTPRILESAYEYLRATVPFSRWRLPSGAAVKFRVIRDPKLHGSCEPGDPIVLRVSALTVGHTCTLMETIAHEMIHVYRPNAKHGAEFRRLAKKVCRIHGFDERRF